MLVSSFRYERGRDEGRRKASIYKNPSHLDSEDW